MGIFGNAFSGWHLVIILLIVLLFGAAKLPALASSIGQSMRILKKESKTDTAEEQPVALIEADSTARSEASSSTGNPQHSA